MGLGLGLGLPDDTNVAPGLTSINSTRQHTQQALMERTDKQYYNNNPYTLQKVIRTTKMSQKSRNALHMPDNATHLLIVTLPNPETLPKPTRTKLVWLDMHSYHGRKVYFRSPVNYSKMQWYNIVEMYYNNAEDTLSIKYTVNDALISIMEIVQFEARAKGKLTLQTISNGTYMGDLLRW